MKTIRTLFLAVLCTGCLSQPTTENKIDSQSINQPVIVQKHDSANNPDSEAIVLTDNSQEQYIQQHRHTTDSIEDHDIEFGFSNEQGKQLIILPDTLVNPSKFTTVISNQGKLTEISYLRRKAAKSNNNGRQLYFNFDNYGGYLYEVKNGIVSKDWSVVFMSKNFLSDRKHLELTDVSKTHIPASIKSKIESVKGRKIKKYKCLGTIDKNRSIYLMEFNLKKDSALGSLAFVTPTKVIYKDYAAQYHEESTFRAGDGGVFDLDYYKVLAVFENQGKIEIITDWLAEEGYSIEYMEEDGTAFKTLRTAYRYSAPD